MAPTGPTWFGVNTWCVNVNWGAESVYFFTLYHQVSKKLDTGYAGWNWTVDLDIGGIIVGMVPNDEMILIPPGTPRPVLPLVEKAVWDERGVITWPVKKALTQVKSWFEPAFGGEGFWVGYDIILAWRFIMVSPYAINKALGKTKTTGGLPDPFTMRIHTKVEWTKEIDAGAGLADEHQKITLIGIERKALAIGVNPDTYLVEVVAGGKQTLGDQFWSKFFDDTKVLSLKHNP